MPQRIINNSQIQIFSFTVKFDIRNLSIVFDISNTVFNGSGVTQCQGINFSVVDSGGLQHLAYDWDNPAIATPTTTANPQYLGESTFTLDLSETFMYALFFQKWRIRGAIRDGNGNTFETTLSIFDVCMPENFTDSGYVEGTFLVTVNCASSLLTAKDLTVATYKKELPFLNTNNGVLYYPQGTVSPVPFTSTPFSNNVVFTGIYRLVNTRISQFDIGDGGIVQVEYVTASSWDFDCENNMINVLCCIMEVQDRYDRNCNNARGAEAHKQLMEIIPMMIAGLIKEFRGGDASSEAKYIREKLRCDCGKKGITRVSPNPANATVYQIVINEQGGTKVTEDVSAGTKTFTISSRIYITEKANINDLGFSITPDTQTQFTTKYQIALDYNAIAEYILNSIESSSELLVQLNTLITQNLIDLSTLNGRCVIDLTASNYFLSYRGSATNVVKNIIIGATTYSLPASTTIQDTNAITAFLNGLSLGTFEVGFSSSNSGTFLNVLSINNINTPVSMTFTVGSTDVVVRFAATNKSLVAVLQSLFDYLCELSAAQIVLGTAVTVCSIVNGEVSNTIVGSTATQAALNQQFALALCAIRTRILQFTSTTCNQIKALFIDRPASLANSDSRIFGYDASGNCTGFTMQQIALGIIAQIKTNTAVRNSYCSIPACGEPVACPDIDGAVVTQVGNALVLQSVSYNQFTATNQTLTVRYRQQGDPSFTTVTAALVVGADGIVSPNLTVLNSLEIGVTYEVFITNNCGGAGFVAIVETSTCPAPTSVTVEFVDEASPNETYNVNVTWVGDALGQYDVEYKLVSDVSWITAAGSPVTGLSLTINGLDYEEEYVVRVRRFCNTSSFSEYVDSAPFEFIAVNANFVNNSGDGGVTFTNVVDDSLLNPFTFESGDSFPLSNTQSNFYFHEGFSTPLAVTYTPLSGGSFNAEMYKNNVLVESVPIVTDGVTGLVAFSVEIFAVGDLLRIEIVQAV